LTDPKRLPSMLGYEVARPAGVDTSPGTASDKGAGTLYRRNLGTRSRVIVVENSLALASTRGPSGRDDLSKAGAISSPARKARGYVWGKRLTSAR
jgi:hypothetical protein